MSFALRESARIAFAPPKYLSFPATGIDISASGIKAAELRETPHGLVLKRYAGERLPQGAFVEGEIADRAAVLATLATIKSQMSLSAAHVSLPESKSYLFEMGVAGTNPEEQRIYAEQHLEEFIPLNAAEAAFDIVPIGRRGEETVVAGVGYARRVIDDILGLFDEAKIKVLALESETFAEARALTPPGDESTLLLIDFGKTTTKLSIISARIPRFATTVGIGGHALTLAVQKHFGVTDEEAKRVKAERGIVPTPGNEDYIAAMLSTVSAIRDEITQRLDYWQSRAAIAGTRTPVSRALLVGGNASLRGLPEYLESALKVPVVPGDVFTNFASHDHWLPPLEYAQSLAFGTSIGLALRTYGL